MLKANDKVRHPSGWTGVITKVSSTDTIMIDADEVRYSGEYNPNGFELIHLPTKGEHDGRRR